MGTVVTRDLLYDGTRWRVREMSTTRVPGARGDRCLIFESEGIIRRAWLFPTDWATLDDEGLWALLDQRSVRTPPAAIVFHADVADPPPRTPGPTIAELTRSLLTDLRRLCDVPPGERGTCGPLVDECGRARLEMRAAIVEFAGRMRREGIPPERVLVTLKQAVQEGITGVYADEPIAAEVLEDGTRWCIDAYYAA